MRIAIALSFYAFIAIGIAEGGLGVLIPSIQETYNLTSASISLLFLSQVTGYIFAALASSILSSSMGMARMLLLASTVLTCALVTYALSPYWWLMVATGTFLGLGIGLIDAGINSYIASEQQQADLMGLLHAFYGIGALLGPAIATTLLALNVQWRGIYLVFATFVGIMVAAMLWAVVYDYKPLNKRVQVTETNAIANLRVALTTPIVFLAAMFLLIYVGTEVSVGNWAYSVQSLSRGTPKLLAGYSVSGYWVGLTVGRAVTGRIVNRLGAVRTLDSSLLLLGLGLVAWWLLPNQLLSLPIIGFALAPIFPLTIWLMPQRVPPGIVPAAIGFMTSIASLGAATIPSAVGTLATRFSLEIIPVLMLPLAIIMTILHRLLVQFRIR
ncbi:MFS transporter [Scytonema hofmannii PCC 7110]|uniref:MFS transporter n=1 Tax=Scytonema hofmannii PCC 7110 TaxID=128403 RepID=A0A139X2B8_9CYAN|nr:MFS transporter [Scytonema hofmannii]KYC38838.1 MFS transporter [Scytonema hofmannii PCC 7110]